jgi:hypothetical protein
MAERVAVLESGAEDHQARNLSLGQVHIRGQAPRVRLVVVGPAALVGWELGGVGGHGTSFLKTITTRGRRASGRTRR